MLQVWQNRCSRYAVLLRAEVFAWGAMPASGPSVLFQMHKVTKCNVNIPGAARLTMFRSHFVVDVQSLTVSTPVSHAGGFIDQSTTLEPPNALPSP